MKKGQFKIQQTAFMLLGITLFFVLVGLFFLIFQSQNLREEATSYSKSQSIAVSKFLSSTTEFNCVDEEYCVDTDKLIILKDKDYRNYWPSDISYIKIRKTFPKEEVIICTKNNYPDCNTYNIYDENKGSESSAGSFISLCRWEKVGGYSEKVCDFGKLIIGYEIK